MSGGFGGTPSPLVRRRLALPSGLVNRSRGAIVGLRLYLRFARSIAFTIRLRASSADGK